MLILYYLYLALCGGETLSLAYLQEVMYKDSSCNIEM